MGFWEWLTGAPSSEDKLASAMDELSEEELAELAKCAQELAAEEMAEKTKQPERESE